MAASDHLHPEQSGKYVMSRAEGDDSTSYRLNRGERAVGNMLVIHHKQHTGSALYPVDPGKREGPHDTVSSDQSRSSPEAYDRDWAVRARIHQGHQIGAEHQVPLFLQPHQHKHNEVFLMAMAKPDRAMAGTMLGVADADARAKTGVGLAPSHNLSEHSFGLTKHLAAKGVVPKSEVPDMAMNDITWEKPDYRSPFHDRVSHADLEAGRQAFRNTVRRKSKADPRQGKLF